MASKNDLKDTKNNTQTQQQSSNALFTGQQDATKAKSNDQYAKANSLGADVGGAYRNLAAGGNLAPAAQQTASGMQGLGGPAGPAQEHAGVLASTGGVDMGALTSTVPKLQPFQSTGGLNEGDKSNYLGGGVYKDMADTGGFTPADKVKYMQQATATVPAMYQSMADDMQRRRAVQGGYSPGFTQSQGLLARTQSQSMNDAVRNAQVGLNTQVNSNKLAGAGGLQAGQGAFSTLQTGNQLRSIDAETAANQQAQALRQQGEIAGTGLETSQANTAAENQRAVLGLQNSNMMGGLSGLTDIYGTNVNAAGNYNAQNTNLITGQASANQGYEAGLQRNAEANPGFMDELSGGLGMAGGALAGAQGFMGAIKKPVLGGAV